MMRTSILFVTLLAVPVCLMGQDGPSTPPPPADVGSVVTLVSPEEPGIPLTISGTIYRNDRTTPQPGVLLYLYQVDATGEYHRDPTTRIPRLNGWLRTDKDGRYEIRTIRPSSYPNSRVVAHIHSFVMFPDGKKTWIQDFLFLDDPHLSKNARERAKQEGLFSRVLQTTRGNDGTLRAVRNIAVEP